MTVCIAGINHAPWGPVIITACDRKIAFGSYFSAEGVAMKITGINRDWSLMFAGHISPLVPLVEAIKERMQKRKTESIRQFARECSAVYKAERPSLIENEVLGDYDIRTYDEYVAFSRSADKLDLALHDKLKEKIKEAEENWNLLFAGFDSTKKPHIFVICEGGKIQYCDTEGFAAIGSGGWRSLVALSSYQFNRSLPFSQAVFGIAAAKFAAESAEGVGEKTILAVLEPDTETSPVWSEMRMRELKTHWAQLPRFPKEAEAEVWQGIVEMTYIPQVSNNPMIAAYLAAQKAKQSAVQTSTQVR